MIKTILDLKDAISYCLHVGCVYPYGEESYYVCSGGEMNYYVQCHDGGFFCQDICDLPILDDEETKKEYELAYSGIHMFENSSNAFLEKAKVCKAFANKLYEMAVDKFDDVESAYLYTKKADQFMREANVYLNIALDWKDGEADD